MKIYTITLVEKITHSDEPTEYFPEFGDRRCVGFYESYEDAIHALLVCNLHREYYEYCIIEEIGEGLFKNTNHRWIFKREGNNRDNYIYVQIAEPEAISCVRNFGVG